MKVKNGIAVFSIVCIVVCFYSCSAKKDQVGMLLASPVFIQDYDFVSSKLKENGISVVSANANNDDRLQIAQADQMIKDGVKVIIIIPVNTNTAASIVRVCNQNKVKVIAYERIISNCNLDYFISFDNVLIGELIAQKALKLKPQGKYMILNGDKSDRNAVWVGEGFMNALIAPVKSGQIQIVYSSYIEDWSNDVAKFEFNRYIKLSNDIPDVILSAWNGMNDGIFTVLDEYKPVIYPIVGGQDADNEKCREARNKKQRISLFKSYKVEATAAAELTTMLLNNKKVETNKSIFNGQVEVPSIVLSQMGIEEF